MNYQITFDGGELYESKDIEDIINKIRVYAENADDENNDELSINISAYTYDI